MLLPQGTAAPLPSRGTESCFLMAQQEYLTVRAKSTEPSLGSRASMDTSVCRTCGKAVSSGFSERQGPKDPDIDSCAHVPINVKACTWICITGVQLHVGSWAMEIPIFTALIPPTPSMWPALNHSRVSERLAEFWQSSASLASFWP